MWCTVFHSEKCRGTHKHCLHVQPQRERCECISHEFIVAVRFNLDRHLISLYFARKIRNRFIETHANINGDAVDEAKTSEIRVNSESVQHCSLHSLCLYKDYKLFSSKYKEQFWVSTFMNYIYIMLFLFLRKCTVYCVDSVLFFLFFFLLHMSHINFNIRKRSSE